MTVLLIQVLLIHCNKKHKTYVLKLIFVNNKNFSELIKNTKWFLTDKLQPKRKQIEM